MRRGESQRYWGLHFGRLRGKSEPSVKPRPKGGIRNLNAGMGVSPKRDSGPRNFHYFSRKSRHPVECDFSACRPGNAVCILVRVRGFSVNFCILYVGYMVNKNNVGGSGIVYNPELPCNSIPESIFLFTLVLPPRDNVKMDYSRSTP